MFLLKALAMEASISVIVPLPRAFTATTTAEQATRTKTRPWCLTVHILVSIHSIHSTQFIIGRRCCLGFQ